MIDPSNPASVLDLVQQQVSRLSLQRDQLLRQLSEVDARIAAVAGALGLDPENIGSGAVAADPPPAKDGRRAGSMVEFAVNAIADAENGTTRTLVRRLILQHPEFGPKLQSNPNHFYNFIKRLIDRGEIDEKHGRLWLAGRAPDSAPTPFGDRTLFNSEGGGNA